jgi:lipopolysaccharide export LptBFGC system permease protein LptF
VVVAIVAAIVSIVLGQFISTYGIRSRVDELAAAQAAQKLWLEETLTRQKMADDAKQKLDDLQAQTINRAVDDVSKRQQLLAIEQQELKEMVLEQRRTR